MGNSDNNNKSKNPATPDKASEAEPVSRVPTQVVKVDGQGNIISGQQVPEGVIAPQVLNAPNNSSSPSPPPPAPSKEQEQQPEKQEQKEDQGFDIEKAISESTKEIKSADDAQKDRVEKQKRLMTAVNSRRCMESVIFINNETQQEVGRKLRYLPDVHGKTIYDYMNDPEIQEHIGFKVDENDPKDGSFIEKQISIYWINPVF